MRYGWKVLVIGALTLLLLIPLLMLRGLVTERQQRADAVRAEIAGSSSREQRVVGPLLRVQIEEVLRVRRKVTENGVERDAVEQVRRSALRVIAPEKLSMRNVLRTETRHRGLFSAMLYHDAAELSADFVWPTPPALDEDRLAWTIVAADFVLGLGDNRGIGHIALAVDGQELAAEPGTGIAWLPEGVRLPLPATVLARVRAGDPLQLAGALELTGSERLSWVPVGGETQIDARADWPHPGFQGNYLPQAPEIDEHGFRAQWSVSRLSSQAHRAVQDCPLTQNACAGLYEATFSVALVDPVDRYLKTDRAMKYALLFLVVVFGAVFFIEVLKGVAVHPLQYGLSGLALAIFFLLLLALSEHLGFGAAYGLAALACVALIATYMGGVLGSRRRGLGFAGLLGLLFGLLFGLLQSEDYALLIGAVALFAALSTVMLLTRRLNWYRLDDGGRGG
ncbi:MAG: cell envelope integrity protein CreD [Gammaproteobacteria bacterium HGW-Gammaproteobacteria-4]|jgi:inner membrane protein|nr:MAG: cell envelope integrity protein CreD [Gammaproteobacteria bacterium HGW-Gammaproteobacteria-4]